MVRRPGGGGAAAARLAQLQRYVLLCADDRWAEALAAAGSGAERRAARAGAARRAELETLLRARNFRAAAALAATARERSAVADAEAAAASQRASELAEEGSKGSRAQKAEEWREALRLVALGVATELPHTEAGRRLSAIGAAGAGAGDGDGDGESRKLSAQKVELLLTKTATIQRAARRQSATRRRREVKAADRAAKYFAPFAERLAAAGCSEDEAAAFEFNYSRMLAEVPAGTSAGGQRDAPLPEAKVAPLETPPSLDSLADVDPSLLERLAVIKLNVADGSAVGEPTTPLASLAVGDGRGATLLDAAVRAHNAARSSLGVPTIPLLLFNSNAPGRAEAVRDRLKAIHDVRLGSADDDVAALVRAGAAESPTKARPNRSPTKRQSIFVGADGVSPAMRRSYEMRRQGGAGASASSSSSSSPAAAAKQTPPLELLQRRAPKLSGDGRAPIRVQGDDKELEWADSGSGDVFGALYSSGVLWQLEAAGYRYLFVSDAANGGATLDGRILTWFAASGAPAALEVAPRVRGFDEREAHAVRRKLGWRLLLREAAQAAAGEEGACADCRAHRYLSTGSLWLHVPSLAQRLEECGGRLPLPVRRRRAPVDPRRPYTKRSLELRTEAADVVGVIDGALPLLVPRERWSPARTTAEILALRSDAYVRTAGGAIALAASRGGVPPRITLDAELYDTEAALRTLVPGAAPSLIGCSSLAVRGKVIIEAGVCFGGDVEVVNAGANSATLPAGTYINRVVRLPDGVAPAPSLCPLRY